MNNNLTIILQIFFDYDRPPGPNQIPLTQEWIAERFNFFMRYTYPSIKNQRFKDFKIFIICGDRKKYNQHIPIEFTWALSWPRDVVICHNLAKYQYLKNINTDFVSILRIDSDDMMHRDCMLEVKDMSLKHMGKTVKANRFAMVFRKNIQWDQINNVIAPHWRHAPPFVVHLFNKSVYKKWGLFKDLHYTPHGKMGGRCKKTVELSPGKICVVKHEQNISILRRGIKIEPLTENQKLMFMADSEGNYIVDQNKINEVLENFGVKKDD